MKALICGGRHFADYTLFAREMDRRNPGITEVIHGGAQGADGLAGLWAVGRNIHVTVFRADWTKHGRAAGPLRNQRMLDEGKPDVVFAFPGGPGTRNMVTIAKAAGVPVVECLS